MRYTSRMKIRKKLPRLKLHQRFDYYVLVFFLLSFIGWLWEVAIYLVTEKAFINRGIYFGPYLPIYGIGGIFLYLLLRKLKHRPAAVFFLSFLICSVLEYFTSWFLERLWGIRWWDYSGWFLNINGRVCLAAGLVFGLGGAGLVCFLLPWFEKLYERAPLKLRILISVSLLAVFIADSAYAALSPNTGYGITSESAESVKK